MTENAPFIALGLIILFALAGIQVPVAFFIGSAIGFLLLYGDLSTTMGLMYQTAFEGLRDYNLMVIPLFAIMGLLVARSGAARDLFLSANSAMRRLPGRLAVATVVGNTLFAAVTGVAVAAAATFSHISYPEMRKMGYDRSYAAGCIAGSSVLGLLIPPSVYMIIWAILTEQSIGKLFAAGILPGILLALLFGIYCTVAAMKGGARVVGREAEPALAAAQAEPQEKADPLGLFGVLAIIVLTLGGIWGGYFTATEGSAVGLVAAIVLALAKGLGPAQIWQAARDAGMIVTPIMLLLAGAAAYSKVLALGGVPQMVNALFADLGLGMGQTLLLMVVVWMVMGLFVDGISIMLLTTPLFFPIAMALGMDPIVFALVGILIIEAGVLTPPFGIGVFVVKAAVPDRDLTLGQIFRGVTPYWIAILIVAATIYLVPPIATWIPSML